MIANIAMRRYRKNVYRISQLLNALYGPFNSSPFPLPLLSRSAPLLGGPAHLRTRKGGGATNSTDRRWKVREKRGTLGSVGTGSSKRSQRKCLTGKDTSLKYYYLTSEARQKQQQHEGDRPRPGRPVRQPDRSQGEGKTNTFVGIFISFK